jgi:hypothetical protein
MLFNSIDFFLNYCNNILFSIISQMSLVSIICKLLILNGNYDKLFSDNILTIIINCFAGIFVENDYQAK